MSVDKMKITAHGSLLSNVFTRKITPFHALKELVNNSLAAESKNITISIKERQLSSTLFPVIAEIEVLDDGYGVPYSQFKEIIMKVATRSKTDGLGVGRFSALQLGRVVEISTVAYDPTIKKYTSTKVTLDAVSLENEDLDTKDFDVPHTELDKAETYYKVRITSLYDSEDNCSKRNKLGKDFTRDVLPRKLFENYPEEIFKEKVRFNVWGEDIDKNDYCIEEPGETKTKYTDPQGKEHDIKIKFYTLKLKNYSSKIFLQGNVNGYKSTIQEFSYSSNWILPEDGAQLIYVESDAITPDLCANFSLESFGIKDWTLFQTALKEALDKHYKRGDAKYASFISQLQGDKYYPFGVEEMGDDNLSVNIFNRSAFIIEGEQRLLANKDESRELVYTLLKKVIEDGNTKFLVENIMNLTRENKKKLVELLDITNLDSIVRFSSEIALRKSELEFFRAVSSNVNTKTMEARKYLGAMLFRNLWLIAEHYHAEQFKRLEQHIAEPIDKLYKNYLDYKPNKKDGNLIEDCPRNRKTIPNQYVCEERIIGHNKNEVLFIDIRAPHFCLTQLELNRFDQFAFELEKSTEIPKAGYCYRLYMICNKMSDLLESSLGSRRAGRDDSMNTEPFFYSKLDINGKDIRLYVLTWDELFHLNDGKLTSQSKTLQLREVDAQAKFIQCYSDLMDSKSKSIIRQIK